MGFVKKQSSQVQVIAEDERTAPRDFEGLCGELNKEDHQARRWAARDLAQFPTNASEVLVARLRIEEHPSVRTAILSTLAHLGDSVAISGLMECLHSDEASLRNEAIEVLKEIPDEVAHVIEKLLSDADSDVRIFAVNILESLRHQNVEKWLMTVIENDTHVNVCATALDLLSEVGTIASLSALQKLKARFSGEPYITFSADLAIKRIQEGEK